MPIFDLFSKRQKKLRGEQPDTFQYTEIPNKLRVQIVHIIQDTMGRQHGGGYRDELNDAYKVIHDSLAREYGLFVLSDEVKYDKDQYEAAVLNFLLKTDNPEQVLDVVEFTFRVLPVFHNNYQYVQLVGGVTSLERSIAELNQRFLENGVGFQYESGEIIRMDSLMVHSEVVKPALVLLRDKRFSGANEEFLKAHEHYRHGRYKECLNECLKAFESTMKSICKKQGWSYTERDTAKKLIEICFDKKLIPDFLQAQFSSLRANLESGIPTVRNRQGGHGQGPDVIDPPPYLAGYLLHLTATTILFLVEAEKSL